eukprot:1358025-Amorphochlora_amoeboformis.AAC.1
MSTSEALSALMKKTKKGKLRLKGGFDKKSKRKKKLKLKKKGEESKSSAPLTEKRAQDLFKSVGEDNLRKLMKTSSVPSAKEYMYVGGKYIKKGSASFLLEERTKKKSDHWCK